MHLDFRRPRRAAAGLGWLLLGAGLLLLGGMLAWHGLVLDPGLRAAEGRWRELQAALAARQPASVRGDEQQLAVHWQRGARVARELAAPWEPLFAVLEAAADRPVALLSIEPDATRGELVLTGEARDHEALLDYYRYLQGAAVLSAVVLQTHQVNQQDRQKPVRFRVSARWGKAA
jgi:Tfp pilus assembly protein PilN